MVEFEITRHAFVRLVYVCLMFLLKAFEIRGFRRIKYIEMLTYYFRVGYVTGSMA